MPRTVPRLSHREVDRMNAAALSAMFIVLSLVVRSGRTQRFDDAVRARQPRARRGIGRAMAECVKVLGKPEGQLPLAALTTYCLRRAGVPGANAVASAALIAFLADKTCKRVVRRRRPPSYRGPEEDQSYPSGHTTATAALTFTVFGLLKRHETLRTPHGTVAAALLTALVAESRLYLDEHWFSDVVGGALLGGAAAHGALRLRDYSDWSLGVTPPR